jgi:hypothetical protein
MFSFPVNLPPRVEARNANRDDRVMAATDDAITALNGMLTELRTLRTAMTSDDWRETARTPGGGYHLAEYVGRQFDAAGHGLRRFYEASILATTTAGGYEPEIEEDQA